MSTAHSNAQAKKREIERKKKESGESAIDRATNQTCGPSNTE